MNLVMNWMAIIITIILISILCILVVELGGSYPRFDATNTIKVLISYNELIYMVILSLAGLAIVGPSIWFIIKFLNINREVGRWEFFSAVLAAALLNSVAAVLFYLNDSTDEKRT